MPVDPLEVVPNLWRSYVCLFTTSNRIVNKRLQTEMIREGLDVTPRQSWIMMAVEEKPHNQATIAEILEVNANQMVREVDQLERKRLIRRIRNPENRREVLLQVTAKGKRLLSKMNAGLEARDARIFHPISMVEVHHLTALVRAIIADYHAKRP